MALGALLHPCPPGAWPLIRQLRLSRPHVLGCSSREPATRPEQGVSCCLSTSQPLAVPVFLGAPPSASPTGWLGLGHSWAFLGPLPKHWPPCHAAHSSNSESAWNCC